MTKVSMGCYLKRPQLRAKLKELADLLENTFQWAATSNALSYQPVLREANLSERFQWAATSNALSYKEHGYVYVEFESFQVSMGCYLKRPQLHRVGFSCLRTGAFQWAATSNALSYSVPNRKELFMSVMFQWAATSNALSYHTRRGHREARVSFNGLLPQTPSATPALRYRGC